MDPEPPSFRRISLLGQPVDLVTAEGLMRLLQTPPAGGAPRVVANHNAHSLFLVQRHPQMRAFYERADLIEADSMPLIFWGMLLGEPIRPRHQQTYLVWRERFWDLADAAGLRVFHLGGAPGVAERAVDRLARRAPRAAFGTHHGYFDARPASPENEAVIRTIRQFNPDILFVGMGMPRQEIWIHQNLTALPACTVLPVGAAFDYEAGIKPPAPRWMGRLGLEWAYRFSREPRRLFWRYGVEPWRLLPAAAGDLRRRLSILGAASDPRVGGKPS